MTTFTERFKRVPGSGSRKRYVDLATGQEISYRQAQNRAGREGLTRATQNAQRKAKATLARQEQAAFRKQFLYSRGITHREFLAAPELRLEERHLQDLMRYHRNHISFERHPPAWAKNPDGSINWRYLRELYDRLKFMRGPVGGFVMFGDEEGEDDEE